MAVGAEFHVDVAHCFSNVKGLLTRVVKWFAFVDDVHGEEFQRLVTHALCKPITLFL
jgi:hypothetical protein